MNFRKPDSTLEGLAKLKPRSAKSGAVTAGNASGLNDGAAAVLVASEVGVKRHGLRPLARIVSSGVAGVEPRIMGIGPVNATARAEACGSESGSDRHHGIQRGIRRVQVLSCTRSLGLEDNDQRINPRRRDCSGPPAGHERRASAADGSDQLRRAEQAVRAVHDVHRRGTGLRNDYRTGLGSDHCSSETLPSPAAGMRPQPIFSKCAMPPRPWANRNW